MKLYPYFYVLLLAAIALSCKHSHVDDHDHDHDDMLLLTGYSADFEIFAEAIPFSTGNPSKITVYVTQLADFKPLNAGSITATLTTGNQTSTQTVNSPSQPGVYLFSLTPSSKGKATLTFHIKTDSISSEVNIIDIRIYDDKHEAEHAAHYAHVTSSNGVAFGKEQSWKIGFATEVVKKSPFYTVIKTSAQIQPSQTDERVMVAKASGIVTMANNDIVSGKAVKAGQALFSIDASSMPDNNLSVRWAEVQSEYNRLKTEYERKAELAKDNIVSQTELQQAKSALETAQASYRSLQSNFSTGKQSVSSPLNGFVSGVMVQNGQYVEAGQQVLRVAQNLNLYIKAEVQPKYYSLLSAISSANIVIPALQTTYSLEELNGKVVSYGKASDLNNPLIPVIFQIQNTSGLLPGTFVDLYIKTHADHQALSIPNTAIVEEMGAYFAFVQLTPEYFEKRPIVTGTTDGFRTEITEGISDGERVVSKGAIFVKLAQAAGALDPHAGHVH